jgi:hypothetical protein
MVALVTFAIVAWPFNVGFYEFAVNQDPEGEDQLYEWQRTTLIFRHTTGVLCGQVVALITGAALVRRHRWPAALAIAALFAAALAVTAFVAGQLLGRVGESFDISYTPTDDPVFVRMLVRELAAYPLYALAGVGIGGLLRHRLHRRARLLVALVVPAWVVVTLVALTEDDAGNVAHWLYWAVPPIGAAAALAQSALSMDADVGIDLVLRGDWGDHASMAMLIGAAGYALLLTMLAVLAGANRDATPASSPPPAPDRQSDAK